ncbi:MAG: photosystem I reaction center subunit XII [Leptolyngbyaceae cyanobacterium SM1_1_3]|nr:photosystem I reaction center subunit XII [Leptolyngbyaceae cyanobacterium SM1_1_3]NJN04569.1 photosystem I reaction center subunit XII [Leptolyngbyaceae cyanobacterium RM1_1_2]NJO11667.1 photosystem I reaction center subunit XII [Leptolyngbyaceae cyanobacterium SL_1_1]
MASLREAGKLGIQAFDEIEPSELRSQWSDSDIEAVIYAAYRQVFGNEYVMSSDRLRSAESLLRRGVLSVREFIRALAQSELYREKFFYCNFQTRFIELNFKHLLGRAPYDEGEIAEHVGLYSSSGYEAEIDSYLDSGEYQKSFGDRIVPYYRDFLTQGIGQRTVGFSRLFQLYRGYASSDRAQNEKKGRLTWELARNTASPLPQAGAALRGIAGGDRSSVYRVKVTQTAASSSTRVRQGMREFLVPYDQLSKKLQQLNQKGNKVVSVTTT